MKRRSGFTLIELLVTMTIMVILMTLAVVNIRGTQERARDTDRRNDIESMARQLDSLYSTGFSFTYGGSAVEFKGRYPTTVQFLDPAVRQSIFSALPAATTIDPSYTSSDASIGVAVSNKQGTNKDDVSTLVNPTPGFGDGTKPYLYQPLDDNGNLCVDDSSATPQNCRRFNLYYRTEYKGDINVVRSRYQ